MDENCLAYYKRALQMGFSVFPDDLIDGFKLRLGGINYYFFGSSVPVNEGASTILSSNKHITNMLLKQLNIPAPKASCLDAVDFDYETLNETIRHLKFPLVVKPQTWSSLGADVYCKIPSFGILYEFCENLFKAYPSLSFEEFHSNLNGYRVLVFRNKIIDVIARFPAMVIGNGNLSIEKLVEIQNKKRAQQSSFYAPIKFDFEAHQALKEQNLTKESIPESGQKVIMGYTCNASRGGTIKAHRSGMCPENKKLFLRIAREFNVELAGIDVHCTSLHVPIREGNGIILEVNYNPSIRIHEEGVAGTKTFVTKIVLRHFIFKHPFSYFYTLLKNPKFKAYIFKLFGGFIILLALGMFFIGNYLGMI